MNLTSRLAKDRAIVRLDDGRIGVLVFWPRRSEPTKAPRVVFGDNARSTPVLRDSIVEVLAPSSKVAS